MKLTFKHKRQESANINSYIFIPEEPVTWIAGQSIKLEVPTVYGPNEHRFTISSAPAEKVVMITTRISDSPFKQGLEALKAGDKINGFGIEGDFTWRDTNLQTVFVAAGIGVTPYRSILKQRLADNKPIDVTLIIGARDNLTPFKNEFESLEAQNPSFKLIYQIGRRLDEPFISQHAELPKSLVYLAGPSAMIDQLGEALLKHMPEEQLVRDWFTGNL